MLKFKELFSNIYGVEGDTSEEVARLFVRFQECYESPKFQDKVFTLQEFKEYYKEFTNSRTFTYYKDWAGFNVPGTIVDKFINGRFDPLTKQEQWLVNQIKGSHKTAERYYVIGYKKGAQLALKHEIAHAKFYTNPAYRMEVLKAIEHIPDNEADNLAAHLSGMGYAYKVIADEIHAYTLCEKSYLSSCKLWSKNLAKVQLELQDIFKRHS